MKKFKFQLETLLRVTRRKKDDAEREFAAASRRLEEAREGLQTLLAEMQKGQQDYDALSQSLLRSEQITQALDHLVNKVNMDCHSCALQEICEEVEKML